MSTRHWSSRSGAQQRQEESTRWLKQINAQPAAEGRQRRKSLYQVLLETPTPKVSIAQGFLSALLAHLPLAQGDPAPHGGLLPYGTSGFRAACSVSQR